MRQREGREGSNGVRKRVLVLRSRGEAQQVLGKTRLERGEELLLLLAGSVFRTGGERVLVRA